MLNNSSHVRMDSSEADYQQKLASAKAQSGMFRIMNEGAGGALIKDTKDPVYGVPRMPAGEIMDGKQGGFSQGDNELGLGQPYNSPATRLDQTGNLQTGRDATNEPSTNPEFFAAPAERMGRIAKGEQGFYGYNDRQRGA